MSSYTLRLYTGLLSASGSSYITDITTIAQDWKRSIRLDGGYWLGSFSLYEPLDTLRYWFYTYLGAHVEETTGGGITWEGMIAEMQLSEDFNSPALDVTVMGYIHTAGWRYTTPGTAAANASDWISTILTNDCATYLTPGQIVANTLQVETAIENDQYAWDEIMRVTELGDASGNPWQVYCHTGRTVNYRQIPVTTPDYYIMGGLTRRRSLDEMTNYVDGEYTDATGKAFTLAAASNAVSIATYGRRMFKLSQNRIATATMEAYRDTYLKANAYPWSRPIGSESIRIYSDVGQTLINNPFAVRPGVVRDLRWPTTGQESGAWLPDRRDFLVDEVEVSGDGNISLRASDYNETDMRLAMIAAFQRQNAPILTGKPKKKKLTKKQALKRAWERGAGRKGLKSNY
jgi:hypothetical protein